MDFGVQGVQTVMPNKIGLFLSSVPTPMVMKNGTKNILNEHQ